MTYCLLLLFTVFAMFGMLSPASRGANDLLFIVIVYSVCHVWDVVSCQ